MRSNSLSRASSLILCNFLRDSREKEERPAGPNMDAGATALSPQLRMRCNHARPGARSTGSSTLRVGRSASRLSVADVCDLRRRAVYKDRVRPAPAPHDGEPQITTLGYGAPRLSCISMFDFWVVSRMCASSQRKHRSRSLATKWNYVNIERSFRVRTRSGRSVN